ncbi:MAG: MMPL family transporter [Deltaproteobacteria bacterium]|nr:MMPL family transporter [Deltaproteobacteria bacterium]
MSRAARYVGWLEEKARWIAVGSALIVAASLYLVVYRLPLRADFSYLLPADAPSVRDFARLAERVPARDTMLMLFVAPDAARRKAAAEDALRDVLRIDHDLIERVERDDAATRELVRAHRHLYLPLAELAAAQQALARRIADAKVRANPMFVDLEDRPAAGESAELARLRAKEREASARLDRSAFVSADGTKQVLVIRTAFRATDVDRDHLLQGQLDAIAARIRAAHPDVQVGFTGGVTTTVAEHGALVRGVLLSSLITAALVALLLFVHLRSIRILLLLTVNIALATIVAFGFAAVTVGHLNAATAFLGAIIAGNGVNYGILLVARFLEERRGASARDAMATAISGTLVPTLVASLGAAVAYGSLGVTKFRGFADFALIGGIGMIVCWIASFTLLPVMMMKFIRAPRREPSQLFGRLVTAVFGFRRAGVVCAVSAALFLVATAASWRYITNDPFEYDTTQLRSQAPDAVEARRWMKVSDDAFGRGLAGLTGATYVAVDRPEQVPAAVEALRAIAAREPIVGPIGSILDIVPPDQAAKLALLAKIRAQIDEVAEALGDQERADLLALRPPDGLRAVTIADVPEETAVKLTEKDGRVGLMIAVRPGSTFDERDGRDLIAFAAAVRALRVGDETLTTAGGSVLFADVLIQIQEDGPLVTLVAALAIVVMVLLVVGWTRRAFAVLVATAAGSIAMIAACAAMGLRINFFDFVALPLTMGLGIDYAINIADRAHHAGARVALRSTGGTVFVCSLTTMFGYLSLLVSDNLAIRGFGIASLIGEATCVLAALVVVPAIMALPRPSRVAPALDLDPASSVA